MLFNHLVHLRGIHLLTKLLHGKHNVLLSDLARIVSVELVEHGLQAGLGQEVPYINGGCQELAIVDAFVLVVIHLIDHVANLLVTDIHPLRHQNLLQLTSFDHSGSILINSLELCSQVLHFFLRGSLDEQVHRSLLES